MTEPDMTTQTLTLTEFLLARIAEDEAVARSVQEVTPKSTSNVFTSLSAPTGTVEMSPNRAIAECEAKRRIVERFAQAERLVKGNAEAYSAAMQSTPLDQGQITALKTHGWELAGRRDGLRLAVEEIALPYADHPDYREEWRV